MEQQSGKQGGDDTNSLQPIYEPLADIVLSFYDAITGKKPDVVSDLVNGGLVSADMFDFGRETPLLAAVRANDPAMIRTLVSLGATIDKYGFSPLNSRHPVERTPLQLAAAEGKLGVVKTLQELGADDSLVAPDGAIALRLAAENGHREIVDTLPVRRAGALTRWKVKHAEEMRRMRRVFNKLASLFKFVFWSIPKFLAWTLPKYLVWTAPEEAWKNRHRISGWCRRQIKELPRRMKKAAKVATTGVKRTPEFLRKGLEKIWKAIKRVPRGIWIVLAWVGNGLKKIGGAIAEVLKRIVSFIHTTLAAIISFFKAITMQDVVNGFHAVFRAVFVAFPNALWSFIKAFGSTSYTALITVFGCAGAVVWYSCLGVIWLILWVPKKIWEIFAACGRSTLKGWEELLVWFNPKRM